MLLGSKLIVKSGLFLKRSGRVGGTFNGDAANTARKAASAAARKKPSPA
jgi:hypothetical protein